jgi:hypothetical protein
MVKKIFNKYSIYYICGFVCCMQRKIKEEEKKSKSVPMNSNSNITKYNNQFLEKNTKKSLTKDIKFEESKKKSTKNPQNIYDEDIYKRNPTTITKHEYSAGLREKSSLYTFNHIIDPNYRMKLCDDEGAEGYNFLDIDCYSPSQKGEEQQITKYDMNYNRDYNSCYSRKFNI